MLDFIIYEIIFTVCLAILLVSLITYFNESSKTPTSKISPVDGSFTPFGFSVETDYVYYSRGKWLINSGNEWKYSIDNGATWSDINNENFIIRGFYNSKGRWLIYGGDTVDDVAANIIYTDSNDFNESGIWTNITIPSMNRIRNLI